MLINTAIVTGPTGVLGMAILHKLLSKGIKTYAMIRPNSHRGDTLPKNPLLNVVRCDFRDIEQLPEMIKAQCDAFFHLAWLGTNNPDNRFNMPLQGENIKYSIMAVEVAKRLGCKVFLGAGSQAEYGDIQGIIYPYMNTMPRSGYGAAKLCVGHITRIMCEKYRIRHIWPRIVSIYGPCDGKGTFTRSLIDNFLAGKRPSLTKCEQMWDFLYSDDAAEAFLKMAEKGKNGAIYVIGSGKTRSLREFAEKIREAIDSNLPIGFGERPYYADQVMHLEADISNLTEDTGWVPTTSFEEGIKILINKICQGKEYE